MNLLKKQIRPLFYITFIYWVLLSGPTTKAQSTLDEKIDSLNRLVKSGNRADTLIAQDYVVLSTYYFQTNIDTVFSICTEGIQLIRKQTEKNDHPFLKSMKISEANLLMNIGFTYYYLNRLDESIKAFYTSLSIAEEFEDHDLIADVLTNIANVEIDLGELSSAKKNLEKALQIQEDLEDLDGIGRSLNTLGYIYRTEGNNDKALDYYSRALDKRLAAGNERGAAACFNNIAYIYRSEENYEKAIENYQRAAQIYEDHQVDHELAVLMGNLANCYLEIGELQLALKHGQKGHALAKQQGSTKDILYLSEVLYKINKAIGKPQQALQYYEEFVVLQDSITNEKHYKELINQQLQYEYAEKEKVLALEKEQEIALKELEHSNNLRIKEEENFRLYLIVGVVSILLVTVLIFVLLLLKQRNTIERQSKALELVALRTQMNPHFLFNSLNSIKLFILENEIEISARYLSKFSKLVRLVLENSNKNLISLEEEIEATAYYLELEQIRFKGKFSFEIINETDGLTELPPLVLQPYIENAIWHGIMPLNGEGKISIFAHETDEGICLQIQDNGIGRKKSAELKKESKKQSMGMEITQQRIQSLYEILGVQPKIEIIDNYEGDVAKGTTVKILIPYHA